MDIRNLDVADREFLCDAIKVATRPDVIAVNDRFWQMEDIMQEIATEINSGKGIDNAEHDPESWGLVCDALEIAISPEALDLTDLFKGKEDIIRKMVKEIETQSGCMTHED